jgi:ATP-dependent RNA helicase DDX35
MSVTFPEWVVFLEVVKTSQGFFIHNASEIYPEWIFELAGHFYKDTRL